MIDFGRVAFGNLELSASREIEGALTVRFGEKLEDQLVDRNPPGTVRYSEVQAKLTPGAIEIVAPEADRRNTQQGSHNAATGQVVPPAVLTPPEWGVLTPFRWVEIEGDIEAIEIDALTRRVSFPKNWDADAAYFSCSDTTINRVWDLCRYSIKATLFTGIYVDGDRERIPYEADAYLNQISDYYVNGDPTAARQTFEWLVKHPTWPTEWAPHLIFMAYADWMHNGDAEWVRNNYVILKPKALSKRLGSTGLVHSNKKQIDWNDIIDWPPSERDGYVRSEVNTVVNSFHLAAIEKLAVLADVAGAHADAEHYRQRFVEGKEAFLLELFDNEECLFRDGIHVDHTSQHANFFPLAFGLVPMQHRRGVTDWVANRGMRCSVYAAQYLLEGLFENGAGEAAVAMMVAPGGRSWRTMLDADATITWEAWSETVKPNLDWNHAWGAAPANLLPRYVLGVQSGAPGWKHVIIRPNLSGLSYAHGKVPTPHGAILVDWKHDETLRLELRLPEGVTASVMAPTAPGARGVSINDNVVEADLVDGYWILSDELQGGAAYDVQVIAGP
ncbi:Bacterial alpha-L-rhamnosidase [Posidoniimonas corsicana]|uniref:alpha-L-rhamnosidase n=1 Tax=Posidoniimonas corsicana TaxID=1938618 RepID=A0A5C5VBC3_9BACT|nr:Bacterial alpha-L-rhamnosidase [Posidoniimonas corsicana]